MGGSTSSPITVVGAGVFGLVTALTLAKAGLAVALWDAPSETPNASTIAAGMLAPASEGLFDFLAAPHTALLTAARDRWSALETRMPGLRIDRSGARLAQTGELVSGDWRIADVTGALAALREALDLAGALRVERRFRPEDAALGATLVLAPGAGAAVLAPFAPELACLSPIKGQIAVLHGGPNQGPVLRWPGGYLVPHPDGALVGATMEFGVSDLGIDHAVLAALRDQAAVYAPDVAGLSFTGMAGVRMSSPDGLPQVGPSSTPGVFLAAGARRNGWLLAPLVGEMIAAYVTGTDPGPWASTLHPGRFAQ